MFKHGGNKYLSARYGLLLSLYIILCMTTAFTMPNFDVLATRFQQRWGVAATPRFNLWRTTLTEARGLPEAEQLKRVNEFFNRNLLFRDSAEVWGEADYWTTPLEFLGKGAGDCKHYTIAKYVSLKELGISPEKLRLIYVKAKIGGIDSKITQAHMVLGYYPQADAEPLILDSLITDIRPASRRPDLIPIFSFNASGIWAGGVATPQPIDRLSRWKDVLIKMRAEGFEF